LSKSKDELYIVGVDFKNNRDKYKKILNTKNPSWNDLNEYQGFPFKTGEHFRQFIKKRQDRDGTLKKLEVVRDEIIKDIVKDVVIEKKLSKIQLQEINIKKERIKLQDLRTSINKDIRYLARKESLNDLIKESIKDLKPLEFKNTYSVYRDSNEMVVQVSDCHLGLKVNNEFETYNEDIFFKRLSNYTSQIINIKEKEKINKCHVCFSGDEISGEIHPNIIRANQYGIVEQTKRFAEYASNFIAELSNNFQDVIIHFVTGNHSRNNEKNLSVNADRYENLVLEFMKLRTENLINVVYEDSILDNTIAEFTVKGFDCILSHGDYDNPITAPIKMFSLLDKNYRFIFLGHRHKFEVITVNKCKVITSGTFANFDEFSTNHRFVGEASQTVSIISDKGLVCVYDVKIK